MASQAEIDRFLQAIIGFESGGNAKAKNPYASASGLFGYIDSTWDNFGGYRHARDAPPEVQWQKARLDVAGKLRAYGGDFRKVAMAWYLPAAVNNPKLADRVPAPEAGNTKTPNQYADMVMSRFTGKQQPASGAARAPDAAAPGAAPAAAPKPQTQQQILDYIRATYPDVYGLLNVNPEIKTILLKAGAEKWDRARLQGALAGTQWWKKTVATAREWDASYAQDKATGDALLAQTRTDLTAQARRLGINADPKFIAQMALNIRRLGWTQQQVMDGLAAKFSTRNAAPGTGTATVGALRSLASQYGIEVSDQALTQWTQRIIAGSADENGFRSYLVTQAKGLFPSISDEISVDFTVADYYDPYVQKAVRLGVVGNPAEVDLSDEKWRRALVQIDPETKKRVPMSLDTWERELRTNTLYGWDKTNQGRQAAAEFATRLREAVGQ